VILTDGRNLAPYDRKGTIPAPTHGKIIGPCLADTAGPSVCSP
jgi:hypothetical protein